MASRESLEIRSIRVDLEQSIVTREDQLCAIARPGRVASARDQPQVTAVDGNHSDLREARRFRREGDAAAVYGVTVSVPVPPLSASTNAHRPATFGLNSNVSPAWMIPLSNGVPPAGTAVDLNCAVQTAGRYVA